MRAVQSLVKALRNLTWMTQLGMSVAGPLVLCVLGALWLKNRLGLGGWVMVLGIFLGLGGAVSGLRMSFRDMQRAAEEDDKTAPVSFNEHE